MTTLYDRNGKPVEVPEGQVPAALQSGELGTLKGQRVNVLDPSGEVFNVDATEAGALPEGWRAESGQEAEVREARAEFGGFGSAVRQAVESGAGSATFGASDVIGAAIGGDQYREDRRRRELANPNAALIGEVGGVVAPLALTALTGGAAAPTVAGRIARIASLPTRAALGAGEVAATGTRAVSRALLGESTLARAVSRVGSGAAGGAVEGAAYGAGEALSDAALERDGYNNLAEKLIAGAREGAVFGGAAGGVLAGVSGLARTGVEKLAGPGGLRPRLAKFADETAVHAIDPSKKAARELALQGRTGAVGRELLERGIVSREAANTTEEMLERASKVAADTGEQIGAAVKKLDDAGLRIAPNAAKPLVSELDALVQRRAGSLSPTEQKVASKLQEEFAAVRDAATSGTLTHGQLHSYRTSLDNVINWSKLESPSLNRDLKAARAVVEKSFQDSAEQGFRQLGDNTGLATYQAAKKGYGAARFAEKELTNNMARGQANRFWSLTDTIQTQGGFVMGALTGNIGTAALMGLLAGAGNKFLREKGAGVLSVMAHRLATADTKIARSVGRFVRGTRVAPIGVGAQSSVDMALAKRSNENREKAYDRAVYTLSNPTNADSIGGLAKTAPNVAAATVAKMEQGRNYLLKHLPTPPRDPNQIIPTKPPPPDPVKLAQFARRKQIVDRPLSVLGEIERHTLTREHVEALETVYPGIYSQIRTEMTETLVMSKRTPTYEQRITIGTLFKLPTDPSLRPASIRRTQQMYRAKEEAKPPAPGPGNSVESSAKQFQTQSESLEAFGLDA